MELERCYRSQLRKQHLLENLKGKYHIKTALIAHIHLIGAEVSRELHGYFKIRVQ